MITVKIGEVRLGPVGLRDITFELPNDVMSIDAKDIEAIQKAVTPLLQSIIQGQQRPDFIDQVLGHFHGSRGAQAWFRCVKCNQDTPLSGPPPPTEITCSSCRMEYVLTENGYTLKQK